MSKDRILIVYSDLDIRKMLEIYITGHGYDVTCGGDTGTMLATITLENIPNAMVIEVYEASSVRQEIRQVLKHKGITKFIPVVFLVDKLPPDRLRDLVLPESDLEDFVTRPFDIEELTLRLQLLIKRSRQYEQWQNSSG